MNVKAGVEFSLLHSTCHFFWLYHFSNSESHTHFLLAQVHNQGLLGFLAINFQLSQSPLHTKSILQIAARKIFLNASCSWLQTFHERIAQRIKSYSTLHNSLSAGSRLPSRVLTCLFCLLWRMLRSDTWPRVSSFTLTPLPGAPFLASASPPPEFPSCT